MKKTGFCLRTFHPNLLVAFKSHARDSLLHYVSPSVGWVVGWFGGWVVGWLVGLLVSWLISRYHYYFLGIYQAVFAFLPLSNCTHCCNSIRGFVHPLVHLSVRLCLSVRPSILLSIGLSVSNPFFRCSKTRVYYALGKLFSLPLFLIVFFCLYKKRNNIALTYHNSAYNQSILKTKKALKTISNLLNNSASPIFLSQFV